MSQLGDKGGGNPAGPSDLDGGDPDSEEDEDLPPLAES